jgi:hypothetical protein
MVWRVFLAGVAGHFVNIFANQNRAQAAISECTDESMRRANAAPAIARIKCAGPPFGHWRNGLGPRVRLGHDFK